MAKQEPDVNVRVRIDWHIPEGMKSVYANQVLIQRSDNETFLHFFELRPPLLTGTPDEQRSQLQLLESVQAECVASIVIASANLEAVINALNDVKTSKPSTVDDED